MTALTVEVPTDAIDFTKYQPGEQHGATFNDTPITIELCPVCGRAGLPGRRRKGKTIIHRAAIVKGRMDIDTFCTIEEPKP